MRQYVVRPGDSPASIAAEHAGCPKCARDLIAANSHKETVTHPNGYVSFRDLREKEVLNLPDKWFSAEFDSRPPTYFAALPYSDGVTPSSLGDRAAGVLGDYATLDAATAAVAALIAMSDQAFNGAADATSGLIDQAVREANGSSNPGIAAYAQATHTGTGWARTQNQAMATALKANDQVAASTARVGIQTALATALESAQLALQAVYGGSGSEPTPTIPTIAVDIGNAVLDPASPVAAAAVQALASLDPCLAQNAVFVCAAQAALGLPADGKYGADTATAARRMVPNAPAGCNPRPAWWTSAGQSNCPGSSSSKPLPVPHGDELIVPPEKSGLSVGAIAGIALLGAGAVGGAFYLASHKAVPTRGRASEYKYTTPPESDDEEP